jgi:hypothetical protein
VTSFDDGTFHYRGVVGYGSADVQVRLDAGQEHAWISGTVFHDYAVGNRPCVYLEVLWEEHDDYWVSDRRTQRIYRAEACRGNTARVSGDFDDDGADPWYDWPEENSGITLRTCVNLPLQPDPCQNQRDFNWD